MLKPEHKTAGTICLPYFAHRTARELRNTVKSLKSCKVLHLGGFSGEFWEEHDETYRLCNHIEISGRTFPLLEELHIYDNICHVSQSIKWSGLTNLKLLACRGSYDPNYTDWDLLPNLEEVIVEIYVHSWLSFPQRIVKLTIPSFDSRYIVHDNVRHLTITNAPRHVDLRQITQLETLILDKQPGDLLVNGTVDVTVLGNAGVEIDINVEEDEVTFQSESGEWEDFDSYDIPGANFWSAAGIINGQMGYGVFLIRSPPREAVHYVLTGANGAPEEVE